MFKTLIACLFTIAITIIAIVLHGSYNTYIESFDNSETKLFIVEKGSSLKQIAYKLENAKLVSSAIIFKYGTIFLGKDVNIKAGEYKIPAHSSMKQILKILTSGKFYEHKFVVPEGLTVEQIVCKLKHEKALTGDIKLPLPIEGSLMPTSLKFLRGTSRTVILDRLKNAQTKLVNDIWLNRDHAISLVNKDELINLASIIEKETASPNERGLIASVFYNRLAKKMRLQSDPTVVYGIYGGKGKPKNVPIYKSDLENENEYNTYKKLGLPKSAIANPGYDALYATAHPANTSYLYFVAAGNGTHKFSENLKKHNEAVHSMRHRELEQKNQLVNKVHSSG